METYLVHHGILGQKWGIRRFQNPDGSLTSAGKRRYEIGSDDVKKRAKGIRKELNDYEMATARNRQGYENSVAKNDRQQRIINKFNEKIDKTEKDSRREKLTERRDKFVQTKKQLTEKEVKMYKSRVDKGQKHIDSLIKQATKEGYKVTSKDYLYDTTSANKGRRYINALSTTMMAAEVALLGYGASVTYYTSQWGKKHKVKYVGDANG